MRKTLYIFVLLIAFGDIEAFGRAEATREEYSIYAKVFERIFEREFKPGSNPVLAIFENTINLTTFPKFTYYSLSQK